MLRVRDSPVAEHCCLQEFTTYEGTVYLGRQLIAHLWGQMSRLEWVTNNLSDMGNSLRTKQHWERKVLQSTVVPCLYQGSTHMFVNCNSYLASKSEAWSLFRTPITYTVENFHVFNICYFIPNSFLIYSSLRLFTLKLIPVIMWPSYYHDQTLPLPQLVYYNSSMCIQGHEWNVYRWCQPLTLVTKLALVNNASASISCHIVTLPYEVVSWFCGVRPMW